MPIRYRIEPEFLRREVGQEKQEQHGDTDTADVCLYTDQFAENIADENTDEHAERQQGYAIDHHGLFSLFLGAWWLFVL